MSKSLYFVALLLPPDIEAIANQWKEYCKQFEAKKSSNAPPHITLQPPFQLDDCDREKMFSFLKGMVANTQKIPIILDGFGHFETRIIYMDVRQTSELLAVQNHMKVEIAERFGVKDEQYGDHPFQPHVTIAYNCLNEASFYRAWAEFKEKPLHFEFAVPALTLLKHNGRVWDVDTNFLFKNN
ncbi:Phosphoesterase HXTX [[Leptolyngbya] sp. PCC 7376]|uniref:2'-5' RNA ligase family protein n=1 Tax=[Leptolyngbya] sp. PCC 7376 TaxID=111781 RepID=UPI00029F2BFD|nr:2'-5' RNA ligase family protein [[Leptolyngbya] sp. PCC 7376]AFY37433.1 Phosphoesterase HXTX [[Leptolyngbya] sp. PCC 7376]